MCGRIKVAVVGLDRKGGQLCCSLQRRRKAAREYIAAKLEELRVEGEGSVTVVGPRRSVEVKLEAQRRRATWR
jgi:hypothetical protein